MANNPNQKQTAELDKVGTILGPESHFEGNLKAPNSVRIDGELIGDIVTPGDVYIGEGASCTGNVTARNLYHCGYLKGDVMADGKADREFHHVQPDYRAGLRTGRQLPYIKYPEKRRG